MPASERREQVVEAATAIFAERGYTGTTTEAVARAAGVSQPYVVRMFGTKEALFRAVLDRWVALVLATFRAAIAEGGPDVHDRMGRAYMSLARERGVLLSLMHAFVLGADAGIGPDARAGFLAVWRALREEAGMSVEDARSFLSFGMLVNTLIGLQMGAEASDPTAAELLGAVLSSPELAAPSADGPGGPADASDSHGRPAGPRLDAAPQGSA